MKTKILTVYIAGLIGLALLCQPAGSVAQTFDGTAAQKHAIEILRSMSIGHFKVSWDEEKQFVKYLSGNLYTKKGLPPSKLSKQFLSSHKELFGIADLTDLKYSGALTTSSGKMLTFSQQKNGIEVIGGQIKVRIQNGVVSTIANHYEPEIAVATTPTIHADQALALAGNKTGLDTTTVDIALKILPMDEHFFLVHVVSFPFISEPQPSRYRVYVDALSGEILALENRVMHTGPTTGSGPGIDGSIKSFDTYEIDDVLYLGNIPFHGLEAYIITHTANNLKSLPGAVVQDTDLDNYWEDPAAVDAHYFGNIVTHFLADTFSDVSWYGQSGFNKIGGLYSTVHYGTGYENAFWNGKQMVYGDGDTTFHPLSGSIDVVAHEIIHGVTEAINDLNYCRQPGALNESWSDVFAMFIAMDNEVEFPFRIGEEIMKIDETAGYEAYYALRRMDDPAFRSDNYPENDWDSSSPLNSWGQPEHTDEMYRAGCWPWTDNGGVHINSGIPNKAAYLITTDIGREKAQQIYYLAMFYMGKYAQFVDARDALEQAAFDLYGNGPEILSIQAAFNSVGIY
ncbi:MAG: M4 family metallopeptidase [Proteobacteria bacterium]|nr:M4 family metallopeptidase [Pseudomonadota bacterium]MBU1709932.1 M4 family metallopeptidase [Pseudomonadota bacterium]